MWSNDHAACMFFGNGIERLILGCVQSVVEPGAGELPVSANSGEVLAQDLGSFFVGVASKKTKLDDFGALGVDFGELFEGIVDGNEILIPSTGDVIGRPLDMLTLATFLYEDEAKTGPRLEIPARFTEDQ